MLNSLYLFLAFAIAGLVSGLFGVVRGTPFVIMVALSGILLMTLTGMKYRVVDKWNEKF